MKKILYLALACFACGMVQSCLPFDEPGDELGFGQKLNPEAGQPGNDQPTEGQQ